MNDQQILDNLKKILEASFEIRPDRVVPEAKLFEELDLDSIDAVDLALSLQEMTGRRVQPETFKNVRTVGDVVDVVHRMLQG